MSLFNATTVEEVKKLIDLGHDVNGADNYGGSVLHRACEKGNLNIVKTLCEAGADVNKMNGECYPIDMAAEAGYVNIVKYLIENYPVKLNNVLYKASYYGNIDVLDYLLTLNLELINLNSEINNPLNRAIRGGYIDAVDKLLYVGANTNVLEKNYSTSMVIATLYNRLDILKKLVMFGADYHRYGDESLAWSCYCSYDDISEFLIELGCSMNYSINNMTPLMYATAQQKNNNLKIVKLLLERGADPNFVNDDGKKAIDYCKSDEVRALFIKN